MSDLLKSIFGKKKQLADLAVAVTGRLTREGREQKVAEASRLRSIEEPRSIEELRRDAAATPGASFVFA